MKIYFIKTASARMTKETIKGRFGDFQAYIIRGDTKEDTYNIKEQLKRIGFKWYNGSWWISANKLSDTDKAYLNTLGVVGAESTTPSLTTQPLLQPTITNPQSAVQTKQWQTENEEMSKWYGFPINHNIASWEENFEIDGQSHHAIITLDRLYQKGISSGYYNETKSREHKGLPKYKINIKIPDIQIKDESVSDDQFKNKDFTYSYNKMADKKWGTYNEDDFIAERKKAVKENLSNSKSKIYKQIQFEDNVAKRTPEYRQFLNDIDNKKIQITYDFVVQDPIYGGNYKLGIYELGMGERAYATTLKPLVDVPLAPDKTFGYQSIDIYKTYTIEDFHNVINDYIKTNYDKIQKDYIEYLKSFPFLQSQKDKATESLNEIIGYITGANKDADMALRILQNKGYIRPHKRQKQSPGITVGDEIHWVIDSKKIVNDAYNTQSYASRMPEYFYSVLAYYVHRKVRGIWSWTDMMLMEVMDVWYRRMKEMGATFSFKDVERAIEFIGNIIVGKIYGETKEEKNKRFFEDFYGGQQGYKPESSSFIGGIADFANFAKQYGVEVENITEENAKDIYRTLVKNLHPDLQQDPVKKDEMTERFKKLQMIWDTVPDQYKKADNWYERSIILS